MSAAGSLRGIGMIVRRSLRQHALSTGVTILSAALGTGLVIATFAVSAQSKDAFAGGKVGYDAVLGARGSQLQLVLNTVFHLETSPGNLPWEIYEEIKVNPMVETAIPYAVGDNFRGYRIVGTTEEIFTKFEHTEGEKFRCEVGGFFDPDRREAVLGATVARETGLWPGATFEPFHGLNYDEKAERHQQYTVVGVLEPTNSPSDRVIWIPIEGVFRMTGHVLRGTGESFRPEPGEDIPDEHREVSAVMLKFKSPRAGMSLDATINRQGKVATLAWPIDRVILELFDKMGWVSRILQLVAYMTLLVVCGSILASLYNTMNERRREFAILRSLGARRMTVFCAIVLESSTIAVLGSLLGYVVYAGVLFMAASVVRAQTGVVLEIASFHPALIWTPVGMLVLGALSGLLPAFKAYSTDVASNLLPDLMKASLLLAALAVSLCGCDGSDPKTAPPADPGPGGTTGDTTGGTPGATTATHEHTHVAPHGGALIPVGDHFANFELLFDSNSGDLRLWIHDGHAENPIRLKQLRIPIVLHPTPEAALVAQLDARGNKLTGEMQGDTSEFGTKIPDLIGFDRFEVTIHDVEVRGVRPAPIRFTYPEGEIRVAPSSAPR